MQICCFLGICWQGNVTNLAQICQLREARGVFGLTCVIIAMKKRGIMA